MRIVVIGGGPAGYKAAFEAASLGAEVTVIERERLGGTCLNKGCIPTKTILKTAHVVRDVSHARELGLSSDSIASVDAEGLHRRVIEVTDELVDQLDKEALRRGITVLTGTARFVSEHEILVNMANKEDQQITFDAAILATGSTPFELPSIDHQLATVWTSDEAVAASTLPKSAVIVGGGVIGVEFACAWAAFGVEVTVVELAPQILPGIDARIARALATELKAQGVTIHTKTSVDSLEETADGIRAQLSSEETVEAAILLSAVGRKPASEGLGLDALGIECERGAVVVDAYYRTAVPTIYAVGDVIGGLMLAHVAEDEGIIAARNAVASLQQETSLATQLDYKHIPACIYTTPEVAVCGLDRDHAKELGIETESAIVKFAGNGKALAEGEAAGFVQLLADKDTHEIVGCQIIGPHATEIIHEAVIALSQKLTAAEIAHPTHAHPTISETLRAAAEVLATKTR